jgi:dTDP-4-dehydrorhamnose 3,5-epimerase
MNISPTAIPDVLLIEPKVYGDDRGFFFESYNARELGNALGGKQEFVQDNHSKSRQGVLRGLHYQLAPQAQGKLIRVVAGEIFDVAVDIRKGSATFGCWVGERLSSSNHHQLWVPPGFAHGFLTLSEFAEVFYKTTDFYAPSLERAIKWNDADIGIDWPLGQIAGRPILSVKDQEAHPFQSASLFE